MKCIVQYYLFIIIIITSLTQVFTYKVGSSTKWTDYRTKTHFDFSSLVRPEDDPWKVRDGSDNGLFAMTYYFNFGREHNKKCKGQNAAVTEVLEVLKQPTDTCEILGRPEHRTVGLLDPSKPNKGIYVQYGGGDKCTNGANLIQRDKPRETRFNIHCARKQSDFVIDTPTGSQGATKCILEFRVDSPAGCPGGVYGGVSLFIIMIWGILLFCVYLFGGIAYNINYKNLSGIEAVPNIDFWREFPTYVKDAIVYTFSGISSGINMIRTGMKSRVPENYSDI